MARLLTIVALVSALVSATSSCGDSAPPPPPAPPVPDELNAFYEQLIGNTAAFLETDGEWLEDYGDAPFYGPAFYAREGGVRAEPSFLEFTERGAVHNVSVLRQANADRDWYLANMEEAMMAALGLIELADATSDLRHLADIDAFVDATNELVGLFGWYLPTGVEAGSFALETYGPTAITAAAALLNLQYATYLDVERKQERVDLAARIVATIERRAWDGQRYLFEPGRDTLYLYPNTMMILVLCRLAEQTGDRSHVERAEAVFEGIQPLSRPERGGYDSPYSAEVMGATTDDYVTLSSQNYLTLAMLVLYQNTRDLRYFDEAIDILDFARTRLYDAAHGRLLHHWMDGRIAQPEDLSYWCSGCNLQYLYTLWYLREQVADR